MRRLIFITVLVTSPVAFGIPQFPPEMTKKLSLSKDPDCSVCHNGAPIFGNATTAFSLAMKGNGLKYPDSASVAMALDKMGTTDSDQDGTSDIEELKAGRDPNVNDAPGTKPTFGAPKYGCHSAAVLFSPLAFLFGAVFLCRRKR